MTRFLCLVLFLGGAFALPVHGAVFFIPIDGSDKAFKAESWGYKITSKPVADSRFLVVVELDEEAARSFREAELHLTKKGKKIFCSHVGIVRGDKTSRIHIDFDRDVIDGGVLLIHSDPIKDRVIVFNFGGFEISLDHLVKQAVGGK